LNMYFNPSVHGSISTKGKSSTREGLEKIVTCIVEIAYYICRKWARAVTTFYFVNPWLNK
jgi:hypothetical protein